jgi:hypothetical protein
MRQINQVGSFTGYLPLTQGSTVQQAKVPIWINAVTPWKSILWILQDGYPIWNGPIIGWPHQSITDGTLPLQAASMENIFKYRQLTSPLSFAVVDIFDIFRGELLYALAKTPNGQISGTGTYADGSGIVDSVAKSGQLGSIQETAGYQSVYDCWNDLVTSYGLEFALSPAVTDALNLFTKVQLGLPQMGRLYAQTGLQMTLPGNGSLNYAWQWVPSNPANRMVVTGSGTAAVGTVGKTSVHAHTTVPHSYTAVATANSDLNAGFPLLEGNSSFYGTVTSQGQINAYAKNLLYATAISKSLAPLFVIGGDGFPRIRETQLGDEVMLIATSPLHPATTGTTGSPLPGVSQLLRITGWSLTFPNAQQAEQTSYQLGQPLIGSI